MKDDLTVEWDELKGDRFLGHWKVHEYAYRCDGTYLGQVLQDRKVWKVGVDAKMRDVLRVDQFCVPQLLDPKHPLASFSGSYSFNLTKSGLKREYHGPDVLGGAVAIGPQCLVGQGYWPRFNCDFVSWSINIGPSRQATGGVFFRGPEIIAVIYGVGVESSVKADSDFLKLDHNMFCWHPPEGSGILVRVDGLLRTSCERPVRCERFVDQKWQETTGEDGVKYQFDPQSRSMMIHGDHPQKGTGKVYGPLLLWKAYGSQGDHVEGLEVYDPPSQRFFAIRKNYLFGNLQSLEALIL